MCQGIGIEWITKATCPYTMARNDVFARELGLFILIVFLNSKELIQNRLYLLGKTYRLTPDLENLANEYWFAKNEFQEVTSWMSIVFV